MYKRQILFLFWTITHLARKILIKNEDQLNISRIMAIMAAGIVGSLAYTFSDSFWFSAVEGEVYATSSLFKMCIRDRSHPSRVRGLKHPEGDLVFNNLCRTPRGCVD